MFQQSDMWDTQGLHNQEARSISKALGISRSVCNTTCWKLSQGSNPHSSQIFHADPGCHSLDGWFKGFFIPPTAREPINAAGCRDGIMVEVGNSIYEISNGCDTYLQFQGLGDDRVWWHKGYKRVWPRYPSFGHFSKKFIYQIINYSLVTCFSYPPPRWRFFGNTFGPQKR